MKRVGQVNLEIQVWQALENIAKKQGVSVSKIIRGKTKKGGEIK